MGYPNHHPKYLIKSALLSLEEAYSPGVTIEAEDVHNPCEGK